MPIARVFQAVALSLQTSLRLDEKTSHHIARVLRNRIGDTITVFNGQGGEYHSSIIHMDRKTVTVQLNEFVPREAESSLELYLAQGISRGEKMDYTIQKAVELGVKKIIPLFTQRTSVKLDTKRCATRLRHWQSIIIAACEQSGRNHLPDIAMPQPLEDGLNALDADFYFALSPHATHKLSAYPISSNQRVALLIGPEGGLTEKEMEYASLNKFCPLNLGPRVLRTETAAVAAITALQCYVGDMK